MSLFLLPLLPHKLPRLTPFRYPCYRPETMRATLDVIGEAGFGYAFNALEAAAERRESESELARAFGVIFGTARKFRVMTILQVWFPVLRAFVSVGFCSVCWAGWACGRVLTPFVLCLFWLAWWDATEEGERGDAAGPGDDAQDWDGAHRAAYVCRRGGGEDGGEDDRH